MATMETRNPETSAVESTKASPSEAELASAEVQLMRTTLHHAGRPTGGMSDALVPSAYKEFCADRLNRAKIETDRREREARERHHQAILDGLHSGLLRCGIDPAGMTEDTMRARLQEADAQARAAAEQVRLAREVEGRRRRAESLFLASGCPPLHVKNLDKIDVAQNQRWTQIRDLLAHQVQFAGGYVIALLGISGTGKTQLLTSVIHRCCESLFACKYTTAGAIFRSVRATYAPVGKGEKGITEDEVMAQWASYDLLVIDEIADRLESIAEQIILTGLTNDLYGKDRCIIFSGNLTKDKFAASVGDSIVSRIHEKGEAIVCDWPSYRRPAAGAWRQTDGADLRTPSGLTRFPAGGKQ